MSLPLSNDRMVDNYKTSFYHPSIPSGYTELEYIESTGSQYIDTGYKPNGDTKVELKFMLTKVDIWGHIAYAADLNGTEYRWGIMDGYSYYKTNTLRLDYCKYVSAVANKIAPFVYTLNEAFTFSLYKGLYINGIEQTTDVIEQYKDTEFQLGVNLYLFAGNYNNTMSNPCSGRMYYCRVYSSTGELYYNLIPAKEESTGRYGMYDTTKKVFLPNLGSGDDFTPGPVVKKDYVYDIYKTSLYYPSIPSGYTELEYIESTGSQYIDTGYKPNGNTKVELKFMLTKVDEWGHIAYAAENSGTGYRWGIMDGYSYYKTNTLRLDYCKYVSAVANKIAPFVYTLNEAFTFSLYKGLYINGIEQTSQVIDQYKDTEFQLGVNLYLFAGNYNNTMSNPCSGRMYYCRVYSNTGELYYNLIPAKEESTGKIGMYDAAKKVFLSNKGTGDDFVAGPEVEKDYIYDNYKTIVYRGE